MKYRTLKPILMAIFALFIYIAPNKAMAYGFIEPEQHSRDYYPSDGPVNVTLFEGVIYGNEDINLQEYLKDVWIQLDPSNFTSKISNLKVSIYYEKLDTSTFYNGDIDFDQSGFVSIQPNFALYKPKFVQMFKITGNINTDGLNYGDKLTIQVRFGVGLDWQNPTYHKLKVQELVYRGGTPTNVTNPQDNPVNIYPNPFMDQIEINLEKYETIVITNDLGQKIYEGGSNEPIETSNFPTGVYYIHTSKGICKVVKH